MFYRASTIFFVSLAFVEFCLGSQYLPLDNSTPFFPTDETFHPYCATDGHEAGLGSFLISRLVVLTVNILFSWLLYHCFISIAPLCDSCTGWCFPPLSSSPSSDSSSQVCCRCCSCCTICTRVFSCCCSSFSSSSPNPDLDQTGGAEGTSASSSLSLSWIHSRVRFSTKVSRAASRPRFSPQQNPLLLRFRYLSLGFLQYLPALPRRMLLLLLLLLLQLRIFLFQHLLLLLIPRLLLLLLLLLVLLLSGLFPFLFLLLPLFQLFLLLRHRPLSLSRSVSDLPLFFS